MAEIHHIAQGRVSVYLRHLKNGASYYARFKIEQRRLAHGQRYITESLQTDTLSVALDKAHMRLAEITLRERTGRALKSRTVADEIDRFLSEYESALKKRLAGFTAPMFRGFRKTIGKYFREYLERKPLQDLSLDDMRRYEEWRQGYWERAKEKKVELHGNSRERASRRTVEWEVNAFKQFLRWCHEQGLYNGNAADFRFDAGEKQTRSAFTPAQWRKLTAFMRRDDWLKVGKTKNDSRLVRHRQMLRAYVLFMANTGLRVGEARHLKWEDVTLVDAPEPMVRVQVFASHSKVKRRREVIGTEGALSAIKRLLELRTAGENFCKPNDPVWCDTDGEVINDFREGFNGLIAAAGVSHDGEGKKMTIYCLRHTYITWRLKLGVDIYQLATNCGTSVEMIEQYYSHVRSADFASELTKGYVRKAPEGQPSLTEDLG